jgi:hypothetical protein
MIKKNFFKEKLIFLFIVFLLSRLLTYFYFGIKSDNPLGTMHLPSLDFLYKDLFNTIKYWHFSQHLHILLFGLVIKLSKGSEFFFSIFWFLYSYSLTLGILYYVNQICIEHGISKKIRFFIIIFFIINPNIIFYESYSRPFYSHTLCFLFTQLTYFFLVLFKKKSFKTEILIYVNLLFLSLTWSLFHPFFLILIYIIITIFKKKLDLKILSYFILIFIVCIIPSIKNKIVFNFFMNASNLGVNLSTTLPDHKKECFINILEEQRNIFVNKKIYLHPILRNDGVNWNSNHIGDILGSKLCLDWFFKNIFKDPSIYFKSRLNNLASSHSKFAFEFEVGSPDKLRNILSFSYNLKLAKQIFIFIYMFILYFFLIYEFISKRTTINYRRSLFLIFICYAWLLILSCLLNGYEQERMLYTAIVLHLFFWLNIFKKFLKFSNLL